MKNKLDISTINDELTLNKYNDQYQQIKDALDITESTDSETTDITNFRIINSDNPYPEYKKADDKK